MTGEDLTSSFVFYGEGSTNEVTATLVAGQEAAVIAPSALPSDEMYLVWATNASGFSTPIALNKTEAWFTLPVEVDAGDSFAVYGQNLGADTQLYIDGYGWVTNDAANPYRAEFTMPAISDGSKTIYAHNGRGRKYGWGDALTITVGGQPWDENTNNWVYVQGDHSATGDGTTDDSSAILAALAAADATDWQTVYFEAGTYRCNSQIEDTLTKVRIKGAGSNVVTIIEQNNGLGNDLLDLNMTDCAMEDFKLSIDDGATVNNSLVDFSGSQNVWSRRILFSQLDNALSNPTAGDIIDVMDESEIYFEDCVFIAGKPVNVQNSDNILFRRCDWYSVDDANSLVSIKSAAGVSFEDCTAQHYDKTTLQLSGAGRWILSNPGVGAPRNWYIGGNKTFEHTTHTDNDNHNAAEDIMFESADIEWYGSPTSVSSNVLSFADVPTSVGGNEMYWVDYTVQIVKGTGFGQCRTVVSADTTAETITLDKAFDVTPDATSVLFFGFQVRNIAIYNNHFDGDWARVNDADDPADAGVESYGGSHRMIVDSNIFTDKETQFYILMRARPTVFAGTNTVPPNYFAEFKNNTSTNSQNGLRYITTEHISYLGDPQTDGVGAVGNLFRGNYFSNVTERAFLYEYRAVHSDIRMTIFDSNTGGGVAENFSVRYVPSDSYSTNFPSSITNQLLIDDYINP